MKAKIDAGGVPKDFFNQALTIDRRLTPEMVKKGFALILGVDPDIGWIGYNMEDPVLGKNFPLRRALSLAFNRKDYIELLFSGLGIPEKGISLRTSTPTTPTSRIPGRSTIRPWQNR